MGDMLFNINICNLLDLQIKKTWYERAPWHACKRRQDQQRHKQGCSNSAFMQGAAPELWAQVRGQRFRFLFQHASTRDGALATHSSPTLRLL